MPFGLGDGGGGPTREMLERARRLDDLDGAPRVSIGSPAEFFEHVEREHCEGAPVPVWRGELYFETHRGTLTSQLRTKVGNRRCERLLREVELWSATLGTRAEVDHLWRQVLTQQFHDIIPGSSIAWVHADAEQAHASVVDELERRLAALFDELVPGSPHVVNAAGVDRDEVIEVDGSPMRVRVAGQLARPPGRRGRPRTTSCVTEHSMTNRHLAVRWDEQRQHHVDHRRRAPRASCCRPGTVGAVLELAPDRPVRYDAWDLESWTPGLATPLLDADSVEVVATGPLLGRVRVVRSFGPSTATVTYTMRAGSAATRRRHRARLAARRAPAVDRCSRSTFAPTRRLRHPVRPRASTDPRVELVGRRQVRGVRPSLRRSQPSPSSVSPCSTTVATGTACSTGGSGSAWRERRDIPIPTPTAACTRSTSPCSRTGPGWTTWSHEAERFNVPLRVVVGRRRGRARSDRVAHRARASRSTPSSSPTTSPGDLIVRLHEAGGNRRPITRPVRPAGSIAASLCNLLEEPHAGIEVGDGICALTLRPFEIVTLRLTATRRRDRDDPFIPGPGAAAPSSSRG